MGPCVYCHNAIDSLIALCMKELRQSRGRLAQYDSPHTRHKTFPYTFPIVSANIAGCPISSHTKPNPKVQLHTPELSASLEGKGELSACSSVFHHVCRSLIVSKLLGAKGAVNKLERRGPSAAVAEHTSQVCVCSHLLM